MLLGQSKNRTSKQKQATAAGARLYSVAALLKDRYFAGSFDVASASYRFIYTPVKAEVADRKLQLEGRLVVTDARGRARTQERVKALLAATQGGIGTAPIRAQVLVGGVQSSTAATSNQQQQVAGEAAKKPEEPVAPPKVRLPEVDSTGPLSFCGAIYFHFEPIDARALGVRADLSRVQMNARLAPGDERARALQGVYSAIADALYGKEVDMRLAEVAVRELNKLLS
jgi:hypothetical protein